ncbi:MAG: glycoside hydrolase family 2 protein, partial [Candidatus Heimdallarchaeaceae archaeon]
RSFDLPEAWKEQDLLIHFGAVDWETKVWVNGNFVGEHRGGYDPFYLEISRYAKFREENEIIVSVWDPTDRGKQERGKQVLKPFAAFYTAVSGIWQTVWIEPVSRGRFDRIFQLPNIKDEKLTLTLSGVQTKPDDVIIATARKSDRVISKVEGKIGERISIDVPEAILWHPDKPFLYNLNLTLNRKGETIDTVSSYFGMREFSYGKDSNNIPRILLNGEPLFMYGTLDQGYWPDGLYTAPTDGALLYDIEITKELGFNMIRKHLKTEPARWYYHCDRLGMAVWQDMPNGGHEFYGVYGFLLWRGKLKLRNGRKRKTVKNQFYVELKSMIDALYNHPSIAVWVPFNEGWGQFETRKVTDFIGALDNTRLINSASGWLDKKTGDIVDIHKYPGPAIPNLENEERIAVLGEFGGLGLSIENHMWNKKFKWSYKKYPNEDELWENYKTILEETKKLIPEGLSAAIYTQTTDVEGEINGLLTYDREVLKFDKEKINKLNRSLKI